MKRQTCDSSTNTKRYCRPTRSANRSDNRHRHSSKIHRAIEARDLDLLKKLLANGEKFCYEDGLNCFILAAVSPQSTAQSRWKFVVEMLKLDARGLTAKNEDGNTLLMIYCNSKEKIQHLINLGADVSAVDEMRRSALLKSFLHSSPMLDAFEELLKHLDSDDDVRALIDSLITKLPSVPDRNVETAVQMIISVLSSKPVDLSTIAFEQHPLKRVMDLHNGDSNKRYCLLLSELRTRHSNPHITMTRNLMTNPAWEDIFEQYNIPKIAPLDLSGYFLHALRSPLILTENPTSRCIQCCNNMKRILMLSKGLNSGEVLNPIINLLLKIFQKHESYNASNYQNRYYGLLDFIIVMTRHYFMVASTRNGALFDADNILRLIARLMASSNNDCLFLILLIVKGILPESSIHPYVFLAMCFESITSRPNHEQRLRYFCSTFLMPYWNFLHIHYMLGARIVAVASMPGGSNFVRFLGKLERLQDTYPAAKELVVQASPMKISVASLKEISKWAFRAAVAEFVKDKPVSLSSYIYTAGKNGYIPDTLAMYASDVTGKKIIKI